MAKSLETAAALVKAMGGTAVTASIAGVTPPAVSNWIACGVVPAEYFFLFSERLSAAGLAVDRKVFRFEGGAE